MSPSIDLSMECDDDASMDELVPVQDDVSALEETYQQSSIEVNQDMDFFAIQLDRFNPDLANTAAKKCTLVFGLLDSYYNYARRRLDDLRQRHARTVSRRGGSWQRGESNDMEVDETGDASGPVDEKELEQLENEARTWDLLRRILPFRYRDTGLFQQKARRTDPQTRSRKSYWDKFMLSDSRARERKIVLEWLQNSAESHGASLDEVVSELEQSAGRGDVLAGGWLHTRHKIKLFKRVNAHEGVIDPDDKALSESHLYPNDLIVQLDPDAPTRQARKLDPQDDLFERAVWRGCFEMLRRGWSMAEIRDWCAVRKEWWRAAIMSPLPLSNPEDEDQESFDPRALVRWRRMVFATSRDGGTGDHDRAVHGILAGDIPSVEKVCKSWEDFLFAHYNALLRSQFDTFLIDEGGSGCTETASKYAISNPVMLQSDPTRVNQRLIETLEKDERTAKEAATPFKGLQGAILANDLDKYLYDQALVLSKHANQGEEKSSVIPELVDPLPACIRLEKHFDLHDHQTHRIAAHIMIIKATLDEIAGPSKSLGSLHPRLPVQEVLIITWISYLRMNSFFQLIPIYCSKLSGARRYEVLSMSLISLTKTDERLKLMSIMKRLDLDVTEFVRVQPLLYLRDVNDDEATCEALGNFHILVGKVPTLKYGRHVQPDFLGDDPAQVEDADQCIIRSLEWMLLVPGLFVETCEYATRAYKYFLKRKHLRAARVLFQNVSVRDIIRSKAPVMLSEDDEESGIIWFEEFRQLNLPEDFLDECKATREQLNITVGNLWELECFVRALDVIETLSSIAGISRETASQTREMWQRVANEMRMAKACMRPVLRSWLLVTNQDEPDYLALRQAYLPEVVLAYVSCLHFAGTLVSRDNLLECMDLAAVIAEQGSDVAQEFMRAGRMKELLQSFASCGKALAIWSSEKKGPQSASKKLREMGWSRDLWSVKP